MPRQEGIKVIGVRELTREIDQLDRETAKGIAQENKRIGEDIIRNAEPKPLQVGSGAGSQARASASRNVVAIRAGGPHRQGFFEQWGRVFRHRDQKRPYILGSAEERMPEYEQRYLDVLNRAAQKVGLSGGGVVPTSRVF